MNFFLTFDPDTSAQIITETLLAIAINATFALGLALLFERLWKTASSADRHGLWLLTLIAGILGPILTRLVVPPVSSEGTFPEGVTVRYDLRKNAVAHPFPASASLPAAISPALPSALSPMPSDSSPSPKLHSRIALTPHGSRVVALITTLGSLALLLRRVLGSCLLHRLGRSSRPLRDEDWQQLLGRLQRRLGIRRSIDLRLHASETIPLTWGHRHPMLLLPQSASQWSDERRETVLLHELAHIRRWDCATHGFAVFLQSLAWFHPLGWIALRRLSLEREHACDDWVIKSGAKPSRYAEHLLALSRACTTHRTHGAIAMAQPHRLSTRVTAILDPCRRRSRSPLRLALVACALVLGTTIRGPIVLAVDPASPLPASTNAPTPPSPSPTRAELAERGLRNIEMALVASQDRQKLLKSELDALKEKLVENSAPPATSPTEGPQLSKLDQLDLEIRARITRGESQLSQLKALPPSDLPDVLLTLYPEDQLLQHLSIRKEGAESESEIALARHGAASPEHKAALDRVRSYQKKIEDRIEGILRSLAIQLEASRMELDHLSKASQDVMQVALERGPAYLRYFEKKREWESERLMGDVLARKIAKARFDAQIPRTQPAIQPLGLDLERR